MTHAKTLILTTTAIVALGVVPAHAQQAQTDAGDDTLIGSTAETAGDAIESGADAVADAGEGAATYVTETGEDLGEGARSAARDATGTTSELLDDAQETATNVLEGASEMAEDAVNATTSTAGSAVDAVSDTASDVATAARSTADEAASETLQAGAEVADTARSWSERVRDHFAELAGRPVGTIVGADVHTAQGEDVGEIDQMATRLDDVVAIVGVGGIMGVAEHDVVVPMDAMTWDGEKFVLDGYTEEDLRAMPEVDYDTVRVIDSETMLEDITTM